MASVDVKQQARQLVEELPQGARWDDLRYKICVRQTIEAGIADSDAGRTEAVKAVRARFGLP